MRGIAWRAPYWPWLIRIGLWSPSRNGIVSWSESKLIATAHRAPLGQDFGFMLRPARARPTMRRQVGSGHCQGSPSGCLVLILGFPSPMLTAMVPANQSQGKVATKMPATDPALLPAEAMLIEFARRRLTPVDVLQAVTERVARLNPALSAFVVMNPKALDAAGQSAMRWRAGRPIGPLDGVPVTIKDLVDLAGFPTRRGSRTTASEPVSDDAPLAASLRAAGAVIVGK